LGKGTRCLGIVRVATDLAVVIAAAAVIGTRERRRRT
jgi:hypothetical protein